MNRYYNHRQQTCHSNKFLCNSLRNSFKNQTNKRTRNNKIHHKAMQSPEPVPKKKKENNLSKLQYICFVGMN